MGSIDSKQITLASGKKLQLRTVTIADSLDLMKFWNEAVQEIQFHIQSPEEARKKYS